MIGFAKHVKTGNPYMVKSVVQEATNSRDSEQSILYENHDMKLFVREYNEFDNKFEPIGGVGETMFRAVVNSLLGIDGIEVTEHNGELISLVRSRMEEIVASHISGDSIIDQKLWEAFDKVVNSEETAN